MVKPIIDRMHAVGANDTTINLFLVYLMTFLLFIGLGLMGIVFVDLAIKNVQPPAWIIAAFTALIGIVTTLLAVNHGVQSVNAVQTRTVAEQHATTMPVVEAASQAAIVNAQTIQQVLAAMAAVNQTNANTVSTTASNATPSAPIEAIKENTEATKENTNVTLLETVDRSGNKVTTLDKESHQ